MNTTPPTTPLRPAAALANPPAAPVPPRPAIRMQFGPGPTEEAQEEVMGGLPWFHGAAAGYLDHLFVTMVLPPPMMGPIDDDLPLGPSHDDRAV
jgi:hypothetical protein